MSDKGEPISGAVPEEIAKAVPQTHEVKTGEEKSFDQRARALYDELGLTDVVPDIDKVIEEAQKFSEAHGLSTEFLDDDINLGLILGCSQKLREATDPLYRRRIEDFEKRLIAPVARKGTLDVEELWGIEPERAGLDEAAAKKYVVSKTDPVATQEFIEKYSEQIALCKGAWKAKGYDLDIQVHIVNDEVAEFRRKLRSGGYIRLPEKEELLQKDGQAVELVLLKNYSAERGNMVRHELSYIGDLDFNLLADRTECLKAIARNFGLGGLVDFSLMYAHGDGRFSVFETFYRHHERPIMDMLIDREKIRLRRVQKAGGLNEVMQNIPAALARLGDCCTPPEDYWNPQYKSVYELMPTREGGVYGSRPNEEFSTQLDNGEAKSLIVAYARAIAFAELGNLQEISEQGNLLPAVVESLSKVPYHRRIVNYTPDLHVSQQFERRRSYCASDDDCREDIIHSMYVDLTHEMPGVDFVFSLQNPEIKEQILGQFLAEVSQLAKYCVESGNPKFNQWFVDGIYGYNTSVELREASVEYLARNFPQLAPILEAKKASFNSKRVSNYSP